MQPIYIQIYLEATVVRTLCSTYMFKTISWNICTKSALLLAKCTYLFCEHMAYRKAG